MIEPAYKHTYKVKQGKSLQNDQRAHKSHQVRFVQFVHDGLFMPK